jgi:hypothetical protein
MVPGHCPHPLCYPGKGELKYGDGKIMIFSGFFSQYTAQEEDGFLPTEEAPASGWLSIRLRYPATLWIETKNG